ncbi:MULTISPECIES: glycyl radical protein [Clostridium]|uniref:Benzylsuccinate synthase alpha subunit n=2 Tax=Clostridium TaxID=1485 RepID=D8GM82_CLOLD|nr:MULTISPECIES: formate C-acetyltransferase/glycerol dehydratase family glycyl radical enzyme [Clostridium]ADK15656.1 pyruvate formate-lyase [Clostridium ljungdahlii DSM 13528]AGY74896.1 formate C-acetyltransferase/glycerol dehydratase family glycyl radical enzyme [Clostridium autoethanogenum DSM 10061]ALU35073.1 Glycyl-radical enzyme pyruvate formate-lyase 2 [Clostridium autoethanogenum DSM 10061]OAA86539.1 Benzylsuccinate synthase alpha subunit [Clostridium ljungdahlii DSM 13528]OVY49428.1 
MEELIQTDRIAWLKKKMMDEPRYVSIEQALIITKTYKENEDKPIIIKRALALKNALTHLNIAVEPEEMIVGNRTMGVRYGVVFPESGSSWVDREIETLPTRPQDRFNVRKEDITTFREIIKPYFNGKSLEDVIRKRYGKEIDEIAKVVKINQKDHAQGHICPDCESWLKYGPEGLKNQAAVRLKDASKKQQDFYNSVILVMEGTQRFMMRYHDLLIERSKEESNEENRANMLQIAANCKSLSMNPPKSFHEAVQSVWFLFVILHMESNASSFSPGRMDKFLYPFYKKDIDSGKIDNQKALEIIECLWLKFNQIVYLRNSHSAKFFAGFPIGFNVVIGGQDEKGNDFFNELSFIFLKAQEHLGLPQPNLSVRLHKKTNERFLKEAVKVVSKGSGMPQFFNDEAIISSMMKLGVKEKDARDYAVVGCVEITTQGNNLGWSDAAMFNLDKTLELTLNNGKSLLSGDKIGPDLGNLTDYETFEELEGAFAKNITYFMDKMILACEEIEKAHMDILPSPFLSSVIDNCIEKGMDVTKGGAVYNFSGIQMIQIANLADSLAAIKLLVYEEKRISKEDLLKALQNNFEGYEVIRTMLLKRAPKYGNDIDYVDELGAKWARFFSKKLSCYTNYRGGRYHTGMYTVSAHVPMGENVGASSDGRYAKTPLADGGMSPVYGRDIAGPTAVLKSVSSLDNYLTTNGGLLNMKFLPEFFKTESNIDKFAKFLRTFVDLEIPHIQFNVVRKEDLIAAQKNPENYRSLTVRVAGYTAYFTELAGELQNEIIARTSYGNI